MVTLIRRLVGFVLVVVAGLIYVDMAEKGTFACERATGTCVHSVVRLAGTMPPRALPLADVLGAGSKHSYWDEAPGARPALARARSMADVSPETLYVTRSSASRSRSSSGPGFDRPPVPWSRSAAEDPGTTGCDVAVRRTPAACGNPARLRQARPPAPRGGRDAGVSDGGPV